MVNKVKLIFNLKLYDLNQVQIIFGPIYQVDKMSSNTHVLQAKGPKLFGPKYLQNSSSNIYKEVSIRLCKSASNVEPQVFHQVKNNSEEKN